MSFNLSAWSIKRPVPTLVLFLILSFVGFSSFQQLGIDANPNIDIPAVSITVTQPGAGPTELESQVTKKIEDAVAGLGNIDQLNSKVSDGTSTTTINFVLGTNSDRATNDVRNAVAQIRQTLPADINDPIVKRLEFAGGSIMTYAVTSNSRSPEELSDIVDRQISRALLAVPGVAQVQRAGGFDREITVELNPDRLQALGITATQVNDQIRAFNINLPGGRTDAGGRQQTIRTLGSAESVETLKEYRIVLPNNSAVTLGSIAEVKDTRGEARQVSRFIVGKGAEETTTESPSKAKEVVAFSVFRSTGSTLVTVEEGVRKAVEQLEKTLPQDIKLELIVTRATNITESYEASTDALWEASWMAMLTILFFLRDWRATVIAAIALPLSILPTYWVMQLLGYTLNGMTLLALALTVGNLVDDSVVEIENMDQHLALGKKPRQAALDSSEEIGLAALSGCATIVAVFMPVAFMGGIPGQFFQPFGVTVAVSTLFSTFVARTMTPMLCAVLMKPKKEGGGFRLPFLTANPFANINPYRSLLSWCLRHRITTILISIAFFIGSLQLVPMIPKGLFSNGDIALSTLSVELPPGSTLADTDKVVQQTIEVLRQSPVVKNVLATTGGSGGNANNTASISVNLTPREERKISQQEFEKEMRLKFQNIPGARISFAGSGAAGSRKDLTILLTSENPVALRQASDALERQMREIDGLVEVSSSASLVKPEILIKPDPARAADLGVTVNAIARTASLATIGDNEASLAKFDLPDRQIPIRVKLAEKFRDDLQAIRNLQIPSSRNTLVPLSAVAEITLGSGPATIDRYDRSRQVIVDGNLQGASLGQALEKVKVLPALKNLPADVKERSEGDAKIMQDIFSRFIGALGLAVLCIYAILVLLYNSFLVPFTILVSLPLSIGGALIALLVTQTELGLFALIGIVLLMGLVTKNAIILVDCALANQEEGMPQFKALIESGVSRLRPIMMTSISTIAGMIPIAMGLGAGSQTRAPMAVAVIGGFTTSTLLTLVVVPVLYTYVDNFQRWLLHLPKSSRWRWLRGWGKRSLLVRFYKPKVQ
ncbi:efflux RND transporter permease subunit [Ancylothrix sp. C2]|nr:efflux RND transporter permease subunit [Ancylothrix sp. D3o]MCT7951859.1 efflux RND transporter permease subunit [Ancylothrix sp. D3o]